MQTAELVSALVNWLREQLEETGQKGFVVGLSGGIDSSVAAVLCKRACPDNTLGVIMPCYSSPQDAEDAELLARTFEIPYVKIRLDAIYAQLAELLTGKRFEELNHRTITLSNLKPRLRMTVLYFFANERQYLVVGTGNRCELTVGHFTKYGDGAADIMPLANLLKFQVQEIARYLGIPERIITRPPSPGLWEGQTDAEGMGFTYEELDRYILYGEASPGVKERIESLKAKHRHKLFPPLTPPF
ncbi:NAD+ synthetase [Ammonifex degensii KC4]|uniref:NH(3)-dependent NAD(+) synthetase n=1 Tax=Ammonifex degensii (strain DSM 10501 / KC4) TaxID=429009 RepID=C9R8V0_AMMDK|nr:NAD(+) synthase [Ammonifex degensii]ACX52729.1 NAD+ synthetase [Ammonifex degensii KC4]